MRDIHLLVLKYGIEHLEGFTLNEIEEDLKLTDKEKIFLQNEIRGADIIGRTSEIRPRYYVKPITHRDELYILSFESRFKYLEFEELRDAKNSSRWATLLSLIAIFVSIVSIVWQVSFPQDVNVKNIPLEITPVENFKG